MLAIPSVVVLGMLLLTVAAWWRYRTVAQQARADTGDRCRFSLTDRFSDHHLVNAPHQRGVRWLFEVFARTAARYPDHPALEVPHTGERLTYAELDRAAERIAAAELPPQEAAANIEYLRGMLSQQNAWNLLKQEDKKTN